MSNINFNCDFCGREVAGCTFVNGMKFCAKCYQETFGNKNNMTENLNNMYDAYSKILAEKDAKIADLEAKLAEKEKEIERLKTNYVGGMQNANEATRIFKEEYYKANQTKTEFAIQQLQRVKEILLYDKNFYFSNWQKEISEAFDQIIKELEEK